MKSLVRFLLIILALAGFVDCLIISSVIHLSEGQCSGLGSCSKVLNSSYAEILGISLWKSGILFYTSYTCFLILAVLRRRLLALRICLALLFAGVCFSSYLIYLQAFRINSWCPLCLISAGIQFLSFLGCLYLWFSRERPATSSEPTKQKACIELLSAASISALFVTTTLFGLNRLWKKLEKPTSTGHEISLVTRLDEREIILSDFPEYMTMKHEFEQFIWTKAKDWYYAELLNHAARQKGFKDSTEYVYHEYTKAGGVIDIGPEETQRRFNALKKEYEKRGGEIPPPEALLDELQKKYQNHYDQFVQQLTLKVETDLNARYLLKPSAVNIPINPELMPTLGADSAPIKIIEVSDYHCSFCRKMHRSLEELIQEIGEDKIQLSYVNHYWEELPEGMNAETATLAMRAGYAAWKQEKFWEFTHDIFENQDKENIDSLSFLETIAEKHGLDLGLFRQTIASAEAKEFIEKQRIIQAKAYADKPPTLLINGFFVKADRKSVLAKIKELKLLDTP